MTRRSSDAWGRPFVACCGTLTAFLLLGSAAPVAAQDRFALVVTGATGGDAYALRYDAWRNAFVKTLRERFSYPAESVWILAEKESDGVKRATRENVRASLTEIRGKAKAGDLVLVFLMGHGASADGDAAKFNLVGPDLTAEEWGALIKPIPARVVFVDAASGSFPYLEMLAGPERIVVTANDSAAQQFETTMPEFFVKAFEDPQADLDKNGKVSIWEAFSYASAGVRRWYEERGQLATERPLLDDTADGQGREAVIDEVAGDFTRAADSADGQLAKITYLAPAAAIVETGDAQRTALLRRRAELDTALEQLRVRKESLSPEEYELELEKLLLEIAQIDRRLRSPS